MNRLVRQLLGEAQAEAIYSDQVTRQLLAEFDYTAAVNEQDYTESASLRVIVGVYIDDSLPVDSAGDAVNFDERFDVTEGWEQRLTKQLEYFFRQELSGPYSFSTHIIPKIVERARAALPSSA